MKERAGRAAAGIGIKLDGDAGQWQVAAIYDAVGINVVVNVAGNGAGRRDHAGGARGDRHRVTKDVRSIVHRGRVESRITLTDHFHRDIIGDDGVRRQRDGAGEVSPDKCSVTGTIGQDGGGNKLVIRAAKRVFHWQIIDDGVADVLDGDAENHVAADGHRRVGGA